MITIPITFCMLIAKYLCLLKPFWLRKNNKTSVLLIIIILAMILGVVKIQVWLNDWNNDFFNALSQKETDKLWQLVLWFPALLGIFVLISVNKTWLIKLLTIRWREWLTDYYLNRWFADKNYYFTQIYGEHKNTDNPDQRIAEDILLLISKTLSLSFGFIQSLSMLITFTVILWQSAGTLSFTVGGTEWNIQGYMVYTVVLIVIGGTLFTHKVGKRIRPLNVEKQRSEATFRTNLVQHNKQAELIGLSNAESLQRQELSDNFQAINKNWIDKEEYPQSAAIDLRCVNMVADLWHAPAPKNGQAVGTNTIGSSEACMLGGMAMKWRWRKRMEAAGKPTDKPNLVCGPVQICWHKFARYWDVELREIPMRPGQLFMDPKRMIEACDENTIGVVPTFGVTYTGNYEFPQPLHDALDKFQADTGIDIDMHIDAASGGFLAPFVAPDIVWDFRLPRVKSISASGHKFGLAPLGCGWVIWRDEEALPQELVFNVDYLGGQIGTFAINFSRPAGQVIAQYYEFLRLGREGYTKVQNASYQVAAYLADEIAKLGPYEFICTGRPDEGIPAVCFKLKDGEDPGYTLYDLSERLRLRGWQVPAFTLGGEATDIVVMRIMCRRGFEMDFAELLLEDYKASLKYLSDHPKLQGIAQQNSFKHT